jgi:alkaline phosphatase
MTRRRFLLLIFFLAFLLPGISQDSTRLSVPKVKYAFLFIGDGMGQAQVNLAEAYLAAVEGSHTLKHLGFTKFPEAGFVSTYAADRFITCSAAGGTAMASGEKTKIDHIGLDSSGTKSLTSIATKASNAGYRIGIVTSVSLDHATPASFYAHQPDRDMYFEIGRDMIFSGFDYFAGGGLLKPSGNYRDKPVDLLEEAKARGYTILKTALELKNTITTGKVIVLFPNPSPEASLPYGIDRVVQDPTLADFTAKGIATLNNPRGFFMMVEGGKIDWACHANDAAATVHEVLAFDEAISEAVEFYHKHPEETIIVVTADHETGGLALGNRITKYESNIALLRHQKLSGERFSNFIKLNREKKSGNLDTDFKRAMDKVESDFGLNSKKYNTLLSDTELERLKEAYNRAVYATETIQQAYGNSDPFTEEVLGLMSEKAGIGWTTGSHTGISVPVYALGAGAELFRGYIDNTEISIILEKMLGLD